MRKYVNTSSVPLSIAVFLATDNYDYDENCISATTLLKPIRQTVLSARVPPEQGMVDIAGLVSSRMGSAIHDAVERAWTHSPEKALKSLGFPDRVIQRIKVNPTREEVAAGCVPVYLEQRAYKDVAGHRVSGKFDFVGDGRVEDIKSTSVNTWINHTNDEKYVLQGSIYRWLNPDIITQDVMAIQFIFTDWSAIRARTEKNYPPSRTVQKTFQLLSVAETDQYVRNRLALLDRYWHAPEDTLPLCTDEELWRKAPQWKYYKNPNSRTRSTKNFDNKHEAYIRMAEDYNVGIVVEVPGQVVACKYCAAFPVCTQKDALIARGELVL